MTTLLHREESAVAESGICFKKIRIKITGFDAGEILVERELLCQHDIQAGRMEKEALPIWGIVLGSGGLV